MDKGKITDKVKNQLISSQLRNQNSTTIASNRGAYIN